MEQATFSIPPSKSWNIFEKSELAALVEQSASKKTMGEKKGAVFKTWGQTSSEEEITGACPKGLSFQKGQANF